MYETLTKEDKEFAKEIINQKKISIGTELKHEYREAIDKLNVKHHFCKFHVKQ